MSKDQVRIEELEAALKEVVQYMDALPNIPETARRARAAEAILNKEADTDVLVGGRFTPAGIGVIGAQLKGRVLSLHTQDVSGYPGRMQRNVQDSLYKRLITGVRIDLATKPEFTWVTHFSIPHRDEN